ncbi:MAG: ComF family protein [Chloroflexi bacterium]|nr:ComF family protein [Chloroflexota bacterium]
MPMQRSRIRARGYNQAELLARRLGRLRNIRVEATALRRVTDTPPQARAKSDAERERQVRGAFAGSDAVTGLRVLLVDDVATTGSTLRECAAALVAAGASEVSALVLAREV